MSVETDAAPHRFDRFAADGFGRRSIGVDSERGDRVELLDLAPILVAHGAFVSALGQRVARFASVNHTSYVRLRRLDRPTPDRLVLVSDAPSGWRLSELLRVAAEARVGIETAVAVGLIRQLLPAVTLFGRHNRESAIGTLAPERLIVTPRARLVIAEYAFGSAIETLGLGREHLWRQFRVAMPPSPQSPRAAAQADVMGIGLVALSIVLGRVLTDEEFPAQVPALVEQAMARHRGEAAPLSPHFAEWMERALQLDAGTAFQSPHEAQVAFETVLAGDRGQVTSSGALDAFVSHLGALIETGALAPSAPVQAVALPVAVEAPAALEVVPPRPEPRPEPPPLAEAPVAPSVVTAAAVPLTRGWLVLILALLALVQSVVVWYWNRDTSANAPLARGEGELVVQSRPTSARVSIDGDDRGVTPLTLRLAAGTHVMEVRVGQAEPRVIPMTIRSGVQTAQYVELQNVPTTGAVEVRSEPPGGEVRIDGQRRGVVPTVVSELPPGDHEVEVETGGRTVRQTVRVDAGSTTLIIVPTPEP